MRNRLRVLVFAPYFTEISVRLAHALAEHADVMLMIDGVFVGRELDPAWFERMTAKVKVLKFRLDRRYWRALWLPLMKLAALRFGPDVVHMQEQADAASADMAAFLARRYRLVVTVHDPHPHVGRDSEWLEKFGRKFRDVIRGSAHAFHVHSAFAEAEMQETAAGRMVVQTHHGPMHTPEPSERRDPEPGRILFFGRMEAYKGLGVMLDAMDILNARGRDYALVIAGRGESLRDMGERVRSTRGVTVIDRFLTPQEVTDEFQKASVAVLPYLEATQSGVAAAAIGAERPIVASRTGGMPELVWHDRTGLLVEPGDAQGLAEALDRVLGEPGLQARLAEGMRAAHAELGWDVIAARLVKAYAELTPVR